ncbi:class I SAM-dependent methyltransferase [Streptantibioticus ferralitis]|uniref:Class I SAM-dependent methyltransferase n=1 Tax=Streptantibioticus ferralitis TaxID=236510 RepID=A0ABT5Z0W0_9ACTN|nr:class I SAM-dependent methyltransferase [Streptantibioticus ferralitis]MDF2257450.1 class I SAM-dependent methyltransferase [Streptantibioticus ferralitis]
MNRQAPGEACLVCGEAPHARSVLGGWLRRCRDCGFTWTADAANSQETSTHLYTAEYFESGGYRDYFRHTAQWRYEARRRLRWLLAATTPATLVEAGAAGGFFLEAAREAGIVVRGVETSETCARFAKDHLGLTVWHGTFETAPLDDHVEAVCAFHVLEHVDDPREFLVTARAALAPGGWLAIEVPNIASAAAQRQGRSWSCLQPEYHRWHFDPRTLQALLTRCGFHVQTSETVLPRHYMRPRHWFHPAATSALVADWAAYGSFCTTHPHLGDYLRVLARRPVQRRWS